MGLPLPQSADPRDAILAVLEEEHRLYRRLAAVAEAKRDALLANDVDALTPLVREMEGIAAAVERLEDDRLDHVARLTSGAGGVDDTISSLLPYFGGPARDRLEDLRGGMRETLARVRTLNELNAALVRQALTFTDQWSRLIRAALPATYAPTGAVAQATSGGRSWQC